MELTPAKFRTAAVGLALMALALGWYWLGYSYFPFILTALGLAITLASFGREHGTD